MDKNKKEKAWISGFTKINNVIDEIDSAMRGHDDIYNWDKTFIKIK